MRKKRFLLISLLALALALPAAAQVQDYKQIQTPPLHPMTIPEPQRLTLSNGMTVMLLEDHELPVVEAFARIRTGIRHEPAEKAGLATVLGDVLRTGGTKSMTGDEMEDFLEARGARIETDMGDASGSAEMWCLRQDFPDVFKVFAEVLRNPVFAEDKIAISKNQMAATVARRNDNPMGIMFREFNKIVYGPDSPYARTPEFATLEKIGRKDLLDFHAKYYAPNRILLGLVGDFDSKEMAKKVKEVFGGWPRGPEVKALPVPYREAPAPGVYYIQKDDMTQSDIILGHLGTQKKDNPDIFALDVMNEAWGGGFAARLFSNVRSKKGLAYSVRGAVDSNYDFPGTFNVWMTTKTESTGAGIDALMEEIQGLSGNPLTDEEVQRAKDTILNSFVFNYDSRAKILRQQITYAYYGFPADYLSRYRQSIEKVTTADVSRVAKKYVHKDGLAILVVGPPKGQDRPLESFGKVKKVDITIPPPGGPQGSSPSAP